MSKNLTIALFIFLFSLVIFSIPRASLYYRHYYYLSKSLVGGSLSVTQELHKAFDTPEKMKSVFDYAIFNDQHYLCLGIFPAIAGIPLLPFGPTIYMNGLVSLFLLTSIYYLKKAIGFYLKRKSSLTALVLIIASPALTSLTWRGPWYLNGLIVFALGLMFVWHYLIKKEGWAIVLLLPLFLTKPTTIFYSILPAWEIFTNPEKNSRKIYLFAATIGFSLSIFFIYNYLRFGSPFEVGYSHVLVPQEEFREHRLEGPFNRKYIVSNAIYLFLNPPRVHLDQALRFTFPFFELSRFGVGLVFAIPWFFSYLFMNRKIHLDWLYLTTIIAIMGGTLLFGGEGSFQIGPRYSLDFLPILIFLNLKWLSKNKKMIPLFQKLLWLGFFLNLYFFFLVQLGHIRRV